MEFKKRLFINKSGFYTDQKTLLIGAILIAVVLFGLIYGFRVLNPIYDDWLFRGDDIAQHYTGWRMYRNSQWMFPIGLLDQLVYPLKTSIVYTDSIPLLAVLFKLLSPILPSNFQYFGLYGLLCFVFQSVLATLIVRKFTTSTTLCWAASVLFIMSPILLFRMFAHTALGGQFIILFAIYVWLQKKKWKSTKSRVVIWGIMGGLGVSIQMYFVPMLGLILLGYIFEDILNHKNYKESIFVLISFLISALLTMYLLGGFYGGFSAGAGGVGVYNSNINTLFNPQWIDSFFLKPLGAIHNEQYEGSGYLGYGVIILFIFSSVIFFTNKPLEYIHKRLSFLVAVLFVLVISFILAISTTVGFNDKLLFTWHLPETVIKLLSVFRSSGRFIWVVVYFVMIYSVYIIIIQKKRFAKIMLITCCIIQLIDLNVYFRDYNLDSYKHIGSLQNDIWPGLALDHKHIVFINGDNFVTYKKADLFSFIKYAANNHLTTNKSYFARPFDDEMKKNMNMYIDELDHGIAREDTIYIFSPDYIWKKNYPLNLYTIDGFIVGITQTINETKYNNNNTSNTMELNIPDDMLIKGGAMKDNHAVINQNGILYGPYWHMEKGYYEIVVCGDNLDKAEFDTAKLQGVLLIQKENPDKMIFTLKLDRNVEDFEFRCINYSDKSVAVNSITYKNLN